MTDHVSRFGWRQFAPAGHLFAPDAFDARIGQKVGVALNGERRAEGTLVAADVSADGRSAFITIETGPEHNSLIIGVLEAFTT